MKKNLIAIVVLLLVLQFTQAQGIVYLSNLNQISTNSRAVGSDSWLAESFLTGNNLGGYTLDSVQLMMTNAIGNPSAFTLMIYSATRSGDFFPGNSLGVLVGTADPSTSGLFTYTPASNITLSDGTPYFLVLSAGTTVANGAYEWGLASGSIDGTYNPIGGWQAPYGLAGADIYQSSNGLIWNRIAMAPQFAITATPIPEPGALSLLAVGGLVCWWRRRRAKI